MARPLEPGEDRPVSESTDLTVLNAIRAYKKEAEDAKKVRMERNRMNNRAFLGEHDWSHKQAGQSKEFLPKVPMALEQLSQFFKRALIQFGAWFSADVPSRYPISAQQVYDLLRCFLDHMPDGNKTRSFAVTLSDGVKMAGLESVMTFKVYGRRVEERQFVAESGISIVDGEIRVKENLKTRNVKPWKLAIDLVRAEDYFPDPTGRNLYEIHCVERDLHDVVEMANQGIYDKEAVAEIEEDFARQEDEYQKALQQNQQPSQSPSFRKRVVIDEFWGDILDANGQVVLRNAVAAIANDKFVIRAPEPNPFWHGESPFVSVPLIRVPTSVWHKALYDDASPLAVALSELFNLILDGGLASVWGIKQIKLNWLEDARQVAGGVPQGMTLAIKDEVPIGAKVIENVTEGEAPQDALAVYQMLDREFQAATLMNDLKLGMFPPKQVKATEVVEASQSQAITLDGIVADVENAGITQILRKAYMTILQNLDILDAQDVMDAIGPQAALSLARMSKAERFAAMAVGCKFKVFGLSGTLARVRDFQKLAAYLQLISTNPILLQAFLQSRSVPKILAHVEKSLNINPDNLSMTEEEKAQAKEQMKQLPFFAGITNPGKGQQGNMLAAEDTGEPSLPAEINQVSNPMSGMAAGGG